MQQGVAFCSEDMDKQYPLVNNWSLPNGRILLWTRIYLVLLEKKHWISAGEEARLASIVAPLCGETAAESTFHHCTQRMDKSRGKVCLTLIPGVWASLVGSILVLLENGSNLPPLVLLSDVFTRILVRSSPHFQYCHTSVFTLILSSGVLAEDTFAAILS